MTTVFDTILQLLPHGSNPNRKDLTTCPMWPPDLFAVAATLADRSGCYAEAGFTSAWRSDYLFCDPYPQTVSDLGNVWARNSSGPPLEVEQLWQDLLACGSEDVGPSGIAPRPWWTIALKLMAVADEASAGIGFGIDVPRGAIASPDFPRLFLDQHVKLLAHVMAGHSGKPALELPYIPNSLCKMISKHVLCVQPKTNTPRVGCTLRSYSHHLALLPPVGTVQTTWVFAQAAGGEEVDTKPRSFNLLLVPFPYVVHGKSFSAAPSSNTAKYNYFSLRQSWLDRARAPDVAAFLTDLMKNAEQEVGQVHGLVIPECALTDTLAEAVADLVAADIPSLELFITGTISNSNGALRNTAYTCRYNNGKRLKGWHQSKHHRWCLEASQIPRYHIGHALDPGKVWWEHIDVRNRECWFSVVRSGASLAVLICEDLARSDPVMPAINAIGPNLVVALLMDGPQLERRWPGRYATVLADDPGSSVLTLTSLGMVKRSSMPGESSSRHIALWKEPSGSARELQLPAGHQALVLALTMARDEQFTMDGRTDYSITSQFRLSGVRGVKSSTTPTWMEAD